MKDFIKYSIISLLLVVFQVIILNNIQLFGLFNPFLYILLIIIVPTNIRPSLLMLIGFALGFVVDVFANTYGIHAATTTLMAFIRKPILKLLISNENLEKRIPSFSNFGSHYYLYATVMVLIHHFTLFMFEAFSFEFFGVVILKTLVSSIITIILILTIENFSIRKKR